MQSTEQQGADMNQFRAGWGKRSEMGQSKSSDIFSHEL